MRTMHLGIVYVMLVLLSSLAGGFTLASAQDTGTPKLGYAAKKPVFGGAGPTNPWGVLADVAKEAMKPYGWDIQVCYTCAGGPRAARLVAGKVVPPKPEPGSNEPMPPDGPLDLGATGTQYLWWAYQGTKPFADDPEGPRRELRLVANIQQPSYFLVAVKADSGITDLRQIVERRMPVKVMIWDLMRDAYRMTDHYAMTEEKLKSFGGELDFSRPQDRQNLGVIAGFASLVTASEYSYWLDVSQKYDLKFLELPRPLIEQWAREGELEVRNVPVGLFRGIDRSFPTVAKTGSAIYGRTDMPDDFAYTLAKALDEHQDLLQWTNMNFSYNRHTVWKAYGVPLHPGAAKYYREVGYMK